MLLLQDVKIVPCEDVVAEAHFFGGEQLVGGECDFALVHLLELLYLLQRLLLVCVHVFLHGFFEF